MEQYLENYKSEHTISVKHNPMLLSTMAGNELRGDKEKFNRYSSQPRQNGMVNLHDLTIEPIAPTHVDFDKVYAMLYEEFGAKGEIETKEVLKIRSHWNPLNPENGKPPLEYRMVILKHPPRNNNTSQVLAVDGQEIVGIRDHNLIYRDGFVIVHLSHSFLIEDARGRGLDTVLRAIPVMHAKSFAERLDNPAAPIILYAEQEPTPTDEEIQAATLLCQTTGNKQELDSINMRLRRLRAYQGGSFIKIGIKGVCAQPDFSPSETITANGGPSMVPLNGVWRFVGNESATTTSGKILRTAVSAVYDMYEASGLDPRSIAQARDSLKNYPPDNAVIPLIAPTDHIP